MDCIFCRIAEKKLPAKLIIEDEEVIAFHDNNPQAPVHALVIPRRHIAKVSELTDAEQQLMGKVMLTGKKVAEKLGISESGFRLVFNTGRDGGQHVFHIHLHVLGGRKLGWPPG